MLHVLQSRFMKKYLLSLLIISLLTIRLYSQNNQHKYNFNFYSPFRDRTGYQFKYYQDRVISRYGVHRTSDVYGHKHAGIDIQGDCSQNVFAIGKGKVINIFREYPNRTIFIRHLVNGGEPVYSVYIHVENIRVNIGDEVTENTVLGRIFNKDELFRSEFHTPPHVHLEIRHNVDDNGEATFTCMTKEELDKYCLDPLNVLMEGDKNEGQL